MIGGTDIVISTPGKPGSAALDLIVRCILRRWPDAVVQNGMDGKRYSFYGAVPFGAVSELLVYRDGRSFDSWLKLGADATNVNAMVHLIADDDRLTLVVDDQNDPTMKSILDEAREALSSTRLWAMDTAA